MRLILLCSSFFLFSLAQAQSTWPHTGKFGANTRYFRVINNLKNEISLDWKGPANSTPPDETLKPGATVMHEIPDNWTSALVLGYYSAQTSGPHSLAEFTLSGYQGTDYYDVSLVDGYNLPVRIVPVAGTFTDNDKNLYTCGLAGCTSDLLITCPKDLQKVENGVVVSCLSACSKYHTDEYCCSGAHDKPETCKPTTWATNYTKFFKTACPTAYSYAYDDPTSLFRCPPPNNGSVPGPDYDIIFGFENSPIHSAVPIKNKNVELKLRSVDGEFAIYHLNQPVERSMLRLYTSRGEVVYEQDVMSTSGRIPTNALSTGTYRVVLQGSYGVIATSSLEVVR